MKTINLVFDKTLTSLAGNRFGVQVFNEQVKTVDYESEYEIIFPTEIKNLATSFIQGFFQKFVETFGIYGLEEKVNISSTSIPNLKELVISRIVL